VYSVATEDVKSSTDAARAADRLHYLSSALNRQRAIAEVVLLT
jgi:hypothetical protein